MADYSAGIYIFGKIRSICVLPSIYLGTCLRARIRPILNPHAREQTRSALHQELGGLRLALQLMSRTGTQWTAPQSSRPPKACRRLQPPRRTCHATSTLAIRARENPSLACLALAHAAGCASRPTTSCRPRSRSLAQVLLMHFTMKSAGGCRWGGRQCCLVTAPGSN